MSSEPGGGGGAACLPAHTHCPVVELKYFSTILARKSQFCIFLSTSKLPYSNGGSLLCFFRFLKNYALNIKNHEYDFELKLVLTSSFHSCDNIVFQYHTFIIILSWDHTWTLRFCQKWWFFDKGEGPYCMSAEI